jgi:hypothetical protein
MIGARQINTRKQTTITSFEILMTDVLYLKNNQTPIVLAQTLEIDENVSTLKITDATSHFTCFPGSSTMIVSLYAFLPKKKKTKVHPTPTT